MSSKISDSPNFSIQKHLHNHGDLKEDFCPSCLAIPLAMAGVGASAIGANKKGAYKTQKKILFWSGIATILLAIFIIVYFTFIKKCSDCR
jgi:hypothetical protein